jgi:hypothetical protein
MKTPRLTIAKADPSLINTDLLLRAYSETVAAIWCFGQELQDLTHGVERD